MPIFLTFPPAPSSNCRRNERKRLYLTTLTAYATTGFTYFIEVEAMWRWVTGPESLEDDLAGKLFWQGKGIGINGHSVNNAFSNWIPPSDLSVSGEPDGQPGENFLVLRANGLWSDVSSTSLFHGYLCEWGGEDATHTSVPEASHGSVSLHIVGCSEKRCVDRSVDICMMDPECMIDSSNKCTVGCPYSSMIDCKQDFQCMWDTSSVPARCRPNPCAMFNLRECESYSQCTLIENRCGMKGGCAQFVDSDSCASDYRCLWARGGCVPAPCSRYGNDTLGHCNDNTCASDCVGDGLCQYIPSLRRCVEIECNVQPSACSTYPNCERLDPEGLKYTNGDPPLNIFPTQPSFTLKGISAGIVVTIEEGYSPGDKLIYKKDAFDQDLEDVSSEWVEEHATLYLRGAVTAATVGKIVQAVYFVSSSPDIVTRNITVVVMGSSCDQDGPVYSSKLNRFYEFVPSQGISFIDAETRCQSRKLHDMAGSFVSLTSLTEQLFIIDKLGATNAWLGGFGISSSTGSIWRWKTAFSTSIFYIGDSVLGSRKNQNFTFFAADQPVKVPQTNALYLMMKMDGTWKADAGVTTDIDGFFCAYDPGLSPSLIVAKATIGSSGCVPKKCTSTDKELCLLDLACLWENGVCLQSECDSTLEVADCEAVSGCFFDPVVASCRHNPNDICAPVTSKVECRSTLGKGTGRSQLVCKWIDGACRAEGCALHPTQTSCESHSECKFSDGLCVARLCSPTTREGCLATENCQWNQYKTECEPADCIGIGTQLMCEQSALCVWTPETSPQCDVNQCPYNNSLFCNADPMCVWNIHSGLNGGCERSTCLVTASNPEDCDPKGTGLCALNNNKECVRSICIFTISDCIAHGDTCLWDTGSFTYGVNGSKIVQPRCRPRTISELTFTPRGAAKEAGDCTIVKEKNFTMLIIFLTILVMILIAIIAWLVNRQRPGRAKEFNIGAQVRRNDELEEMILAPRGFTSPLPYEPPKRGPIILPPSVNAGSEKWPLKRGPKDDDVFAGTGAASEVQITKGHTGLKLSSKPNPKRMMKDGNDMFSQDPGFLQQQQRHAPAARALVEMNDL